jgi:hypothetical protein
MNTSVLLSAALMAADLHFQRHDIAEYPSPYQVAVADINGDGKLDIVVSGGRNNKVLWYENK